MNFSEIANRRTNKTLQNHTIAPTIGLIAPTEADVIRDAYGDISGRENILVPLQAFPIFHNPGQKQLDKAGIRQVVNCLFYIGATEYHSKVAKKPVDIIRWRCVLNVSEGCNEIFQEQFEIQEAKYLGTINTGFRYVVIGANTL